MSETTEQKKEEVKTTASTNTESIAAIKKELEDKLALEQELSKAKAKAKETEGKLQEQSNQFQALSQQFEELKKRSMSKEELEASEKKQLAEENTKLKEKTADLEKQVKAKSIEVTRVKVAHEEGLPADLVDMVSGDSDEEIRAKAKKLASHIKASRANETVTLNTVKEVGTETTTKEGVQNQTAQQVKKPKTFAEVKEALAKKLG